MCRHTEGGASGAADRAGLAGSRSAGLPENEEAVMAAAIAATGGRRLRSSLDGCGSCEKRCGEAVLLAAGRGARLGELTRDTPKPLLEVGGVPIIFRIIDGLAGAGVRDVTVITGHAAEALEAALGDGSLWAISLRCIRQARLDGTARALQLARECLGDSPFFVGWGDIVVESATTRGHAAAARPARSSPLTHR